MAPRTDGTTLQVFRNPRKPQPLDPRPTGIVHLMHGSTLVHTKKAYRGWGFGSAATPGTPGPGSRIRCVFWVRFWCHFGLPKGPPEAPE